jgi:excisionase family DNA binding protein
MTRRTISFTHVSRPAPSSGDVTPTFQPLTYSVPEAARLLGINRNTAYQLAARGELPTLRLGKRILVVRASFEKWLESAGGSPG